MNGPLVSFLEKMKLVSKIAIICDNYVPQWWVELDDELSCLFTKYILKDAELFILFAENSQMLLLFPFS